jgi:hypothetical protein
MNNTMSSSAIKTPLHLRLTNSDWIETFKELSRTELGVLFHIRTLDPYGDRNLDVDPTVIGNLLGVHRTSVSRALESLSQKNLIEMEICKARVRNRIKNKKPTLLLLPLENSSNNEQLEDKASCAPTHKILHPCTPDCTDAQNIAPTHTNVHPCTPDCTDAQNIAPTHTNVHPCTDQTPESLSDNASGTAHTIPNSSQTNLKPTTTSSNEKAAVVEGKNFSSDKDQDWLTGIKAQLREIRIAPDNVSWTFSQFPKYVIEDAIAYTAEQKWAFKPAAVYVTACREGKKPEAKSACEDQFSAPPEPDEETLNWLKELKNKRIIKDFYTQPWANSRYRVLAIDTGSSIQPWWEVVEALKAKKQEQDCEKEI